MMEGPKVKLSRNYCAAQSIELAEQTCEVSYRQEMPVVFVEGGEELAADIAELLAGHPELDPFELTWVPRNSCDRRGTRLHFCGWTEKPR